MNWKALLVREYAGSPLRVAANLLVVSGIGIGVGHWLFGAPLDDALAMASMLPGLAGITAAAIIKERVTGG